MMAEPGSSDGISDVHLRMWMHYDTLRQQKSATFLTANTILAAVVGLTDMDLDRSRDSGPRLRGLADSADSRSADRGPMGHSVRRSGGPAQADSSLSSVGCSWSKRPR